MSVVAILKGDSPVEMVYYALEMIKADEVISIDNHVLVKPNYIEASHPSTGITTDARVVEGVVKFLREQGIKSIVIGEGSGFSDTMHAFKVAGVDEVARRWNVDIVDLNKDELVEVQVLNPFALRKVKIAKTALESRIVSVPKLKLHRTAGVTLSLKNMMGAVMPKGSIHNPLSEKIADLASILKPCMAVVDGIIGGEGHELAGKPVEMNLVIAGTDPVAVDAVGTAVMGFDPKNVKHLRLAEMKGVGTCDLNRIKILGEPIGKVRRKFRPSYLSKFLSPLS